MNRTKKNIVSYYSYYSYFSYLLYQIDPFQFIIIVLCLYILSQISFYKYLNIYMRCDYFIDPIIYDFTQITGFKITIHFDTGKINYVL